MPKGKNTNLTVASYKEMEAQGMSRKEMAARLELDPSAISKFKQRHRNELEKTDEKSKPKSKTMASGSLDTLIERAIDLQTLMKQVLVETENSIGAARVKNRELFIKLNAELRQTLLGINSIEERRDSRKEMFSHWCKTMEVLSSTLPMDLREQVFEKLAKIPTEFLNIPEYKKELEVLKNG